MTDLAPTAIVGDIASDLPGAAEVFRRAGISFCCGGKLSLSEAAAKAVPTPRATPEGEAEAPLRSDSVRPKKRTM